MSLRDFDSLRAELELPSVAESDVFPESVEAEAQRIARQAAPRGEDATSLPLVTLDPPGARDLDQAMCLERIGTGFRVHYAIADLGEVIVPGGEVDAEARRRGQTIYLPDGSVPLHPPVISEGALSLLPGQERSAALWTIDVDSTGAVGDYSVRRARVRSIAQLDYRSVQESFDSRTPHRSLEALADLGPLRQAVRVGLGAIELELPEQEVVRRGDEWVVRMRQRTAVDGWNAEISLLTGMCAAGLMLDAGIGLLRTLPPADARDNGQFMHTARALGFVSPEGATPAQVLADLDPDRPGAIAVMRDATALLRGAGYEAFVGQRPQQPTHAGIGAPYAHVTAPLRRLVDRFGSEICVAICEQRDVPDWVVDALPALGDIMHRSDRHAARADRACIDQAEAWELSGRLGERFEAIVVRADEDTGEIMLKTPPVIARCVGAGLREGSRVQVQLSAVDVGERRVEFTYGPTVTATR